MGQASRKGDRRGQRLSPQNKAPGDQRAPREPCFGPWLHRVSSGLEKGPAQRAVVLAQFHVDTFRRPIGCSVAVPYNASCGCSAAGGIQCRNNEGKRRVWRRHRCKIHGCSTGVRGCGRDPDTPMMGVAAQRHLHVHVSGQRLRPYTSLNRHRAMRGRKRVRKETALLTSAHIVFFEVGKRVLTARYAPVDALYESLARELKRRPIASANSGLFNISREEWTSCR
ncbi:hypothetical protein C8Q78DRAFT_993783 [Trametes maxima]|nr:hypothetical protein C8Q78DRAFT_993783 [Trametes maxima]